MTTTPYLIPLEISDEKKRLIVLTNAVKMIANRGYINDLDKQLSLITTHNEEDIYNIKLNVPMNNYNEIYIKYLNNKITNLSKHSLLNQFLQKYNNKKKIIILNTINNKITQTIHSQFIDTEIFTINELLINIVDHIIVPKHILLSEEDTTNVLNEYNVRKRHMPKILTSDPIVRYYNMPVGRICKIIRNSETSGECIYYRLVIKG